MPVTLDSATRAIKGILGHAPDPPRELKSLTKLRGM